MEKRRGDEGGRENVDGTYDFRQINSPVSGDDRSNLRTVNYYFIEKIKDGLSTKLEKGWK